MKKLIANIYCKCIQNKEKRKFIYDILVDKNKIKQYRYENQKQSLTPNLQQIGYDVKGKNNKIIIIENGIERQLKENEKIQGLDIKINGSDNLIKLEMPIKSSCSTIEIGNNNAVIEISQTNIFSGVYIRCKHGCGQFCKIGKSTTFFGANIILDEQGSCIIGKDCMFSNQISIWATDGHSILDNNTGEILNTAKEPIVIGNHVWVGQGARITKNARIGNNCIIGGGTVACKDYKEDNVIIAGNPGKIIKRNVNWDRRNPYYLQLDRSKNLK